MIAMRRLTLSFLMIFGVLAGCAPANRDDLAKEVLKSDPGFESVLEKHRLASRDIETEERKLALKRTTVEQSIRELQRELAAAAASVRARTAELKKRMEPERKRFDLALSEASKELQASRTQRATLGRSIVQLRKTINSAGTAWTAQERSQQEAKIEDMLGDAKRLDEEMAALRQHVRLLKIKLLLIKL